MDQETNFIVYEGVVVPESALLKRERSNRYGSIEDLPDEELADPDELERQVIKAEFEPILLLPSKARHDGIRPAIDESGGVDWGAFASVDFDRDKPEFDKARYKADRLREELRDLIITFDMVRAHIPGAAKYKVLKYLRRGVIELDDISDIQMWHLGRLFLRALKLQKEIARLKEYSERRRQKAAEKFFDSLG